MPRGNSQSDENSQEEVTDPKTVFIGNLFWNSDMKSFRITLLPGYERHAELTELLALDENASYEVHPYREEHKFICPAQFPLFILKI